METSIVKVDDFDYSERIYACDFETTTSAIDKERTWVWAFAYDEVGKFSPKIEGSINDFMRFCEDPMLGVKKRLYFHNLKFDGEFILYHLIKERGFKTRLNNETGQMEKSNNLLSGDVVYIISDVGQWYYIAFRVGNIIVECRDSLKLIPFTLEEVGKAFCKKYKKSSMNYDTKKELSDCTEEDINYIKNDVLVLSEALAFLFKLDGTESPFPAIHSLTIGGACYQRFKEYNYGENGIISPRLDKEVLPPSSGSKNKDAYIRRAYRGGYCYVKKETKGKIIEKPGFTADVNSLYPFVMSYKLSGSRYPVGKGVYHEGAPNEKYIESDSFYFYCRIKAAFIVKPGYVPMIQKKGSFLYKGTEYLESSSMMDFKTLEYIGDPQIMELSLSKDDYIMFFRHYNVLEIEHLDYILFMTADGIFDFYIDFFAEIKKKSKGAIRALAKLFQNDLYGQMAKSDNSSFKKVFNDNMLKDPIEYTLIESYNKKVVNIAIGAAITAKARRYHIETIQRNYDIFCYSDTDSMHCIGSPEDLKAPLSDTDYGAYAIETTWKRARFVRQKTYIEETESGYLNICAAGMTPRQKDRFRELYAFEDFRAGLTIYGGKLKPKRIKGGVILEEVDFTIR